MAITAPPASGESLRAPLILLVDDDPIVLRAIRRLLVATRPSWEIDVAESAASALLLLDNKTYDVAVTDLHMPVPDGLQLLRRLKVEHPTLMRVIHSSHVEALDEAELQGVAHAVLRKTGRPEELVTTLEWALSERRRRLSGSVAF